MKILQNRCVWLVYMLCVATVTLHVWYHFYETFNCFYLFIFLLFYYRGRNDLWGHRRFGVQWGEEGSVLCWCPDRDSLRYSIVDRKFRSGFPHHLWHHKCFRLWNCSGEFFCYFAEESSLHSDSTAEADTNTDLMPASLKQHNLTLELFPNHSENLESAKKVKFEHILDV